jgi:hypothetical protein
MSLNFSLQMPYSLTVEFSDLYRPSSPIPKLPMKSKTCTCACESDYTPSRSNGDLGSSDKRLCAHTSSDYEDNE